jgi:hypothetical protein
MTPQLLLLLYTCHSLSLSLSLVAVCFSHPYSIFNRAAAAAATNLQFYFETISVVSLCYILQRAEVEKLEFIRRRFMASAATYVVIAIIIIIWRVYLPLLLRM